MSNKKYKKNKKYPDIYGDLNYYTPGGFMDQLKDKYGKFEGKLQKKISNLDLGTTVKNNLPGIIGGIGGVANEALSNGLSSGAGNAISKVGSGIGDVLTFVNPLVGQAFKGASQIIGGAVNGLAGHSFNESNIADIEAQNDYLKNYSFNANTTDDIMNQWGNVDFGSDFSVDTVGREGVFSNKATDKYNQLQNARDYSMNILIDNLNNAASNMAQRQMLNMNANFASLGGGLSRARNYGSKKKPYPSVSKGDFAGGNRSYPIPTKADAVDALRLAGLHNRPDVRRKVYAKYPSLKKYDMGGSLESNGIDWNIGITEIPKDENLRHNNNVNGGVQVGVDPQGVPNMVESGEVITNGIRGLGDFVFSNQLEMPKETKQRLKLKGKTYADGASYLSKESKERPNDKISLDSRDEMLNILAQDQEQLKMKNQMMNQQNTFAWGGFEDSDKETRRQEILKAMQTLESRKQLIEEREGTTGARDNTASSYLFNLERQLKELQNEYYRDFPEDRGLDFSTLTYDPTYGAVETPVEEISSTVTEPTATQRTTIPSGNAALNSSLYNIANSLNLFGNNGINVNSLLDSLINTSTSISPEDVAQTAQVNNSQVNNGVSQVSNAGTGTNDREEESTEDEETKKREEARKQAITDFLRNAPIYDAAAARATDLLGLTNKEDYTQADRILRASNRPAPMVSAPRIDDYLSLKPIDTNYYLNKASGVSSALNRTLENLSGGNRVNLGNLALAKGYNDLTQLGDFLYRGNEYQNALREKEASFNRGTRMTNAQSQMQADMANQQSIANQQRMAFEGLLRDVAERTRENMITSQNRNMNRATLSDNLSLKGKEDRMIELADKLPWMYDSNIDFKPTTQLDSFIPSAFPVPSYQAYNPMNISLFPGGIGPVEQYNMYKDKKIIKACGGSIKRRRK